MRSSLMIAILGIATAAACTRDTGKTAPKATAATQATVPSVTVDELDTNLTSNAWTPVDANGESTRKKLGVIPGAVLLTDSDTFSPNELPPNKDKPLVFYCANTHCGASHDAAAKALTAGYTNVKVLPEGIAGWVKAGKKITTI